MRASFELVRRHRSLLWFPVISTGCLALTAGFWVYEGVWLYAVHGSDLLFVPLVVAGLYSVAFVGIFFSVALAGAAAEVIDGGAPSFNDGIDVAWARFGGLARLADPALVRARGYTRSGRVKNRRSGIPMRDRPRSISRDPTGRQSHGSHPFTDKTRTGVALPPIPVRAG